MISKRGTQIMLAVAVVLAGALALSAVLDAQVISRGTFYVGLKPPQAVQNTLRVNTSVTPQRTEIGCESFRESTTTVNCLRLQGAPSTTGPAVIAIPGQGGDTDITLNVQGAGAGAVRLASQLNNYVTVSGAASTGTPTISAEGLDTNINLKLQGKGTGTVTIGSGTPVTSQLFGTCSVSAPASLTPGAVTTNGQTPCTATGVSGTSDVWVQNKTGLESGIVFTSANPGTNQIVLGYRCMTSGANCGTTSAQTYFWLAINP